jgi:microcystin-dependent protein
MAQHDYSISNQSFPAFRADLNNALDAIVTSNSGTAAPSLTHPHMFWADTIAGLLKQRDGANANWVPIGTLGVPGWGLAVPSGMIMSFAGSAAPTGWLKANGASVSRSTYAALFTAIGTTYGAGNGSTTFTLPDLRGEFVRGWDDGRGIDASRAIGTAQSDDFKSHTHNYLRNQGGNSVTGGPSQINDGETFNSTSAAPATGGTETRPRNIALLYCIKF